MSNSVCRNTCYFVKVEGARGARGKNGLASGPLADGSVEARHITNDPDEQAAIRDKLGIGQSGGGGEAQVADFYAKDDDGNVTDTHMMQPVWRAYRLGHRTIRMVANTGTGEGGVHIATGLPFTSLKPGGDPNDPADYNTARGNLCLPMDGMPSAGEPMHGLRLIGDGRGRTIVKQVDNFAFNLNTQSADVANNARDLYFGDFTVLGLGDAVATQTGHIFAISGATDITWERVEFRDFNADAVCFWPSPNPEEETHNVRPVFRDCQFNGGNSANRNCISVEDAVGGLVDNCEFRNACTDSDAVSVAAIDFEPRDKLFYRCANWTIRGSRFYDINRGGVAFYLNGPDYYTLPPTGFKLIDNHFERCKRLWDFSGVFTDEFDTFAVDNRHMIEVTGNTAVDCGDIRFLGMANVHVHHNQFNRCRVVKFGEAIAKGNRFVLVDDNIFRRSIENIVVLHDDPTYACSFSRNTMDDCGIQENTTSPGYVLIARRGEVGVRFNSNRIFNPVGRMKAGFILTDTATYGATAEKSDNVMRGMAYTVQDTFDPAVPFDGLVYQTNGVTISPGTLYAFDIAWPTAKAGEAYDAFLGSYGDSGYANIRRNLNVFPYCDNAGVLTVTIQNLVNSNNTGELRNAKIYARKR